MHDVDQIYTFFKGRVALHAILRAAGIGAGDQVLLPGYTCVVVPNAVLYAGAEPVYLDIDPATYNLDLSAAVAGAGTVWDPQRTRAIIVQHTYGIPCDMDAVADLARRHDLLVIEDSCHTLGSTFAGRTVGSFGEAAFFSSQWSKPVTTGLGGWALVNDLDLRARLEASLGDYRDPGTGEATLLYLQHLAYSLLFRPSLFWVIQGIYRKLGDWGLVISSSTGTELACRQPGDYHKRMAGLQRRQLARLLRRADRIIAERRANTAIIEDLLAAAGLPTVSLPEAYDPVYLRYRVAVDDRKRHPMDFVLWKSAKPGEPQWPSPWGPGRPGWHLECSVMSNRHLGPTFDIHGGGRDLLFPHHENERAQSMCANDGGFARYWVHNGFVTVESEKMSKSLGNFLTIRDALKQYHPEVLRLFLLSKHYRSPLDFSKKDVEALQSGLVRIYRTLQRLNDLLGPDDDEKVSGQRVPNGSGEFFENFAK